MTGFTKPRVGWSTFLFDDKAEVQVSHIRNTIREFLDAAILYLGGEADSLVCVFDGEGESSVLSADAEGSRLYLEECCRPFLDGDYYSYIQTPSLTFHSPMNARDIILETLATIRFEEKRFASWYMQCGDANSQKEAEKKLAQQIAACQALLRGNGGPDV